MEEGIRKLIFPPRCPGGDEILTEDAVGGFCPVCRKKLRRVETYCMKCGKELKDAAGECCRDCTETEHAFAEGRSVFVYQGIMKGAMYRFKYGNRRAYGDIFAAEAAALLGSWIRDIAPDVIIPIPLHFRKKQIRGYNQAEVWARALSKKLGIPADAKAMLRLRATVPQKALNPAARDDNLRNAFYVKKGRVQGKTILLADDIYTTGSTMDEAAKVLLAAGARTVYCLTICTGLQ